MPDLTPFLVYVFITTFTPGPNNILSMTNATRDGFRKTVRFLAGIFVGFFVVMLVSGLLNVTFMVLIPGMQIWLHILGAVYMLYLAYHILRSKPVEDEAGENGFNSFKAGFSMQFINIKVILYGITVFSLFIIKSYPEPIMTVMFAIILALVGFIATSCWAMGGSLIRKFIQKNYRLFNLIMAGLLVYTAIASLV